MQVDEQGYPKRLDLLQTAGTFVNRDLGGHWPGGTYTVGVNLGIFMLLHWGRKSNLHTSGLHGKVGPGSVVAGEG